MQRPLPFVCLMLATGVAAGPAGCTKHQVTVDPIKVEPIHMTVDVRLKVDRELDRYFDYEDELDQPVDKPQQPAAEQGGNGGSR